MGFNPKRIMTLSATELIEILQGKRKSPIYDDAVKDYKALKVHADGEYPEKLIDERRPHESQYLMDYRKKIYKSISKETFGPVVTSLGKIRRSTDWSVSYSKSLTLPKIREGESLADYCEKNFPYYTSLTNWVFSVMLKTYLVDPNSKILVVPMEEVKVDTDYLKPYPFIYNSDQVLDYRENDYAVFLSSKKRVTGRGRTQAEREQWYVVTTEQVLTYAKVNNKGDIQLIEQYDHNLGYLPVVEVRAVFKEAFEEYNLYESRLSTMLPRLDEAVREYSDQQANVVNHLFPERWEYASQNCDACTNDMGIATGQVRVETGTGANKSYKMERCTKCGGTGALGTSGPYKKFVVRPTNENLGEKQAPIPPFGYVTKDVETINVVDKRIEFHQYKALCSINMQFLMQTPLNQSGLAKEVDRDELNTFVYNVAEDLVYIMDELYRIICDYRYGLQVPDKNTRADMLPTVAVPEKFDILSSTYLADEVKSAKDSKLNGGIVSQLELEYCSKKFYNNPEVKQELECQMRLDPMIGATEEEKMLRLQNGGVTKEDYVLSCNIVPFVKKAMQKDKDFISKDYDAQMTIVRGYANEIINAQKKSIIAPEPEV